MNAVTDSVSFNKNSIATEMKNVSWWFIQTVPDEGKPQTISQGMRSGFK